MFEQPFGEDLEIYVYENFLSEAELAHLNVQIEQANLQNLWQGESGNTVDSGTWTNRNFFLQNSSEKAALAEKVAKAYSEKILPLPVLGVSNQFKGLGPINRTSVGQSLAVHDDIGPPELNSSVAYGLVIYLNDDFTGGELYYPNLGLEISPKRGMLVAHSSGEKYAHGVKEVTSGIRYGLTMFIDFATDEERL
jgi:hypothetical protein